MQGKHETPIDLDEYFDRHPISSEEVRQFWIDYWNMSVEDMFDFDESIRQLLDSEDKTNPPDW